MADIRKLIPLLLKWEGGFVNDPDDLGGATYKGVTIATYRSYRQAKGLPSPAVDELKSMPEAEWIDILKTYYWNRWQADKLRNQSVANILVDWVWASGIHGIKRPQQMLGVKADGIVGSITIEAVNTYADQRELFDRIKADRKKFIEEICLKRPVNGKFKRGWLNRLNDFSFSE